MREQHRELPYLLTQEPDLVDQFTDHSSPHRLLTAEPLTVVQRCEPLVGEAGPVRHEPNVRSPESPGKCPLRDADPVVPDLEPMLASTGVPWSLDGWVAEPKWDGWRARVAIHHGALTVRTRNGRVITEAVSELSYLASHNGALLLDGELVTGAGR